MTIRKSVFPLITAVLTTALATVLAGCASSAKVDSVTTRPGVSVDVYVTRADNPTALLLVFEGGSGRLDFSTNGFGIVGRDLFVRKGLTVALMDAPSDQTGFRGGMYPKSRESQNHTADVDAILSMLKTENRLPVWILGVSIGSRSAAYYAVQRHKSIDGVVLVSSSTNSPRGRPVSEFGLERITVPLLAVAHRNDGCPGTPPAGAKRIVDAATSSPNAKAIYFTGGLDEGREPCTFRTHHTFYGIEDEVVSAIAEFIRRNSK